VYTVELQRNGGPLGITISGSDDLYEPLHVSGLTEGGLAERTKAIHNGDTILAINNVPLRGKSLTEAIDLLKSSDDIVTLKISRKLEFAQQQKQKTSLSYLASAAAAAINGNGNAKSNGHHQSHNHSHNHPSASNGSGDSETLVVDSSSSNNSNSNNNGD
jgi:hypothetical protein